MIRFRSGLAVVSVAVLALAGCTGGGEPSATPSPDSSASPGPSVSPSATPGAFVPDPAAAALGAPAQVALLKLGPTGLYLYDFDGNGVVQVDYTPGGAPGYMLTVDGDVSWDGVQVAFTSYASDVVSGDTNGVTDIFLKNLSSGAVIQVSDGPVTSWNEGSDRPRISADGAYVAFTSYATGLVPGVMDTPQVYLYSVLSGEILRVSIDPDSVAGYAYGSAVSAGGRYVAYASSAQGEFGDDNYLGGVYVLDTDTGIVEQISVASDGTPGDFLSANPSISLDGRWIAFDSEASNFVADDTNAFPNIYVRDRVTGETLLVSKNAAGGPGNNDSTNPRILGDGSGVVFQSYASDLVPGDTNGDYDIFYADLATGAIERINVGPGGVEANGFSRLEGLYGSRYAVFMTDATNLGGDGDDGPMYWYVYDLEMETLTKLR
ncbi:MAG: PD40 domain-containing protein [Demequinaceae bacterium]|nr:PD40 domain-containing protein [Demequinaceae bacterium]